MKNECVYLNRWETGSQAKAGVARRIRFNNHRRRHAAHGVVFFNRIETVQQGQAVE